MNGKDSSDGQSLPRVRIVGGGVAGLEAAAALHHLAPELAAVSLVTPDPDFVYKPLLVDEPFGGPPAPHFELRPLLAELGVELIEGTLSRVDADAHQLLLVDGERLDYDKTIICIGGVPREAYAGVTTFWRGFDDLDADGLIEQGCATPRTRLTLVVPPGTSWPLPLYEVALMLRRRADEVGHPELLMTLMTSEEIPLGVFDSAASEAIAETLAAHRIDIEAGVYVVSDEGIAESTVLGTRLPRSGPVIALPIIDGPHLSGLPSTPGGFIPIDVHCAVAGLSDAYAAGDGTSFPIKQGGIATQEADAAAEHIAAALGADLDPAPFKPVLRGILFTRSESISMRNTIAGGAGVGIASSDHLWWPPEKIAGRYLSKLLGHGGESVDLEADERPLEVEVSWPHEWHGDPSLPGREEPSPQ